MIRYQFAASKPNYDATTTTTTTTTIGAFLCLCALLDEHIINCYLLRRVN